MGILHVEEMIEENPSPGNLFFRKGNREVSQIKRETQKNLLSFSLSFFDQLVTIDGILTQ